MNALVIGSANIDLFLKTKSSSHTEINQEKVTLTLGDKIPIDVNNMSLGGNGANVSVGLARLGIPTQFFTYLGNDILSLEIKEKIKKEGVQLITEEAQENNTSFSLIFQFDDDRIIFSHHPVQDHDFTYQPSEAIDFVYLTSIGKEWKKAYQKVLQFIQAHHTHFAFSPGSQQLGNMDDLFFEVLAHADSVFVNKEEAERILAHQQITTTSIDQTLQELQRLGPSLVSVTDGARGAYAKQGSSAALFIDVIPFMDPIEKTGAGDAYASGFSAAYLYQLPIPLCMQWGMLNAHGTMQDMGAQNGIFTKQQMEKMITEKDIPVATPMQEALYSKSI